MEVRLVLDPESKKVLEAFCAEMIAMRPKKGKAAAVADTDDEDDADEAPKKRGRKPKKAKEDEAPKKRGRKPKKAEPEDDEDEADEDDEEEIVDDADEEDEEDADEDDEDEADEDDADEEDEDDDGRISPAELKKLKAQLKAYSEAKSKGAAIKILQKFAKTSAAVKKSDFAKLMKQLTVK